MLSQTQWLNWNAQLNGVVPIKSMRSKRWHFPLSSKESRCLTALCHLQDGFLGFTVYVPVCLSAGCCANKTFASSFRFRVCRMMITSSRDRTAVGWTGPSSSSRMASSCWYLQQEHSITDQVATAHTSTVHREVTFSATSFLIMCVHISTITCCSYVWTCFGPHHSVTSPMIRPSTNRDSWIPSSCGYTKHPHQALAWKSRDRSRRRWIDCIKQDLDRLGPCLVEAKKPLTVEWQTKHPVSKQNVFAIMPWRSQLPQYPLVFNIPRSDHQTFCYKLLLCQFVADK